MQMTTDPGRLAVRILVMALVLVTMSLAGCGKKEIENPYEPVTLAQAVSGESANKLFKFELSSPKILAVEGKLALLTEEGRMEFLFADDLSLLTALDTGYKLAVRREWGATPEIYLVLEHVVDGPDTSFVTADEAPVFPSYQNYASFDRGEYTDLGGELSGMGDSDRSSMLRAYGKQGQKVWLDGSLSQGEYNGQRSYFIDTDLGKFKLDGVNALAELFLKANLASDGVIGVGGPMGEILRRSQQRDTGVTGPMTLEYFRFQNYMVTNG
jgi:hypothetical protein